MGHHTLQRHTLHCAAEVARCSGEGQGHTRVCSRFRAPPVEEHVRGGRLHARGVDGRHVRVVEAVPGALAVAAVRRVVPAAIPAVVVADGVQVVHGRHRLRMGVGLGGHRRRATHC